MITSQPLVQQDSDPYAIVLHDARLGNEHYLLQAKDGITGNDVVKQLCEKVDILSFAEQTPSMNDIFLKVIGKDTKWNEEQIESKS